jgi:hypothetical protein
LQHPISRVARFFFVQPNQNGKNILKRPQKYAMAIKFTKMATKTPVGDEIDQNFPSNGLS